MLAVKDHDQRVSIMSNPDNPVIVELTRNQQVESRHRGALAVFDASGQPRLVLGDITTPVYPRSAVKAFQAIPLLTSGAAQEYGFGDVELALACASHNGEPAHIEGVRTMLRKAGLEESNLECGAHWPSRRHDSCTLIQQGKTPSPLHNNCSGKHAGMLATAQHLGLSLSGYVQPDHPVQQGVRAVLEELTETSLDPDICGTDGCSVPTFAIPLSALALAFAKFADRRRLTPAMAQAAARLQEACFKEPFMVAGTGRFCTKILSTLPGQAFVKVGAEGVYCAALPQQGLGLAIKIDDGGSRAAEVVLAVLLSHFLPDARRKLAPDRIVTQTNWRGLKTGQLRPAEALQDLLAAAA